ncbi:hypothetical protein CHARACLAT_025577, partial [Characodon lateralis]|nr:hypothetical protein [Characodon lateralis]
MREAAMDSSTALSLFVIFLFCAAVQSYGEWSVTYTSKTVCAIKGSTVNFDCTYSHPNSEDGITINVEKTFWFTKTNKDPVDLETREEYAGRVQYQRMRNHCTLIIEDLKESDSALYKFRFITNKIGGRYTGEPGVQLYVSDPHLTVIKYYSRHLECFSLCLLPPRSTYVWYKNGKTIDTVTSRYFGQFSNSDSIACALKGHEDFPSPFFCLSNNCFNVTYSKGRICAFKGSSVTIGSFYRVPYFRSAFWFSPGRSEEWMDPLNPENLKEDSQYAGRVDITYTTRQSNLTITNLRESDSAEYRFMFQTYRFKWGSDLHGTTLTVTALQVQVTKTSALQDITYAELKCHSSCTPAAYHYIWFKNGQNLDHTESTYKGPINTTDKISCAVSEHDEYRAPEVYAPVSPSVSVNSSGDIFEGKPATLRCKSQANPPANYTWYKKTKTSTLQRVSEDSQLFLSSIQLSDSGDYCCVAKNQLGESQSKYLNVDVKYAPKRADVSQSHREVVEGISVNLTCSSDGNPASNYSWYKDNQMMPQGQQGVYQLTSVRSEDSGIYHCKAENQYGLISSSSVHINVEYSPRLPSVSVNPPGEIAVGGSVNLTCSSVANPAATYTWYKESTTSPAASGQMFTIEAIRREHGGNYYCQARNSRGHHNSTLYLIVVLSSATPAVAGSITFIFLFGLFFSAFIIFRKKMASRQTSETRKRPGVIWTNHSG